MKNRLLPLNTVKLRKSLNFIPTFFVILSAAKNLIKTLNIRFFAALRMTKKTRFIYYQSYVIFTVGFLFLAGINANAQEFLNIQPEDPKTSLLDLERAFLEWSEDKDLNKTKGWKWYRRWLDETMKRSNVYGELPNNNALFEAGIVHSKLKNENSGNRTANWSPVGPNLFPDVPNNSLLRGMGRMNTVAFHPTDPETFWVGVAQGGVWKTTNSGESWMPLTDDLPILRISDIAVDPTNPDVMYISVGDYAYLGVALNTDERKRNTHYGLGVYKTTDGGQNWNPTGLTFEQTELDGSLTRRVLIDPNNPQNLVAAGIHGIWKSFDGGDSWTQALDNLIWDIQADPNNPNVIFATTAHVPSLGVGNSSIIKSTDFGENWALTDLGVFPQNVARVEVAVAPSNSNYVYAHCADENGGFHGMYRSTDGGETWELRSNNPNILHWFEGENNGGQGWYDMGLLIDHNDPEKVYAGGVNLWVSDDGGSTWKIGTYWLPQFGNSVHADHHFYAYNPLDDYIYLCNDGGIARTKEIIPTTWDILNNDPNYQWETQWEDISDGMEITSFYRLGLSPTNEGYLAAGSQDNSVFYKKGDQWLNVVLGDGMECFFHPNDENILYASTQNGRLVRSNNGGVNFTGSLTAATEEFGEWTTPFKQHPTEVNSIFAPLQNVWYSPNGGTNWTNLTEFSGGGFIQVSSCFAVSPTNPETFYVGKRINPTFGLTGQFWRTFDNGATMTNVTAGLPNHLYFTYCAVDPHEHGTVYVTVGGFEAGVKVFKSVNGGDDWENISLNLPNIPVNCIIEDPNSQFNTLYIGTDLGVYFKNDLMPEWELYSTNLPNVIVTELEISTISGKLYASTFGRGIWVSDANEDPVSTKEREQLKALKIKINPNPNGGQFVLKLENIQMKNLNLEIVDITGRRVYLEKLNFSDSVFSKNLDLDLNYGMYFLRLNAEKRSVVEKFLVE